MDSAQRLRPEALAKGIFGFWDIAVISFRCAPYATAFALLCCLLSGVMPLLMALATAGFIDSAIKALSLGTGFAGLFGPIAFVVAVVAAGQYLEQFGSLAIERAKLSIRREVRALTARKTSLLRYEHIENPETWDLISRVCKEPEVEMSEALDQICSAISLVLSVLSVIGLLFAHVWWAALATLAFSIPIAWLSLRGGKENYQARRDTEREEREQKYLIDTLTSREAAEERSMFGYTAHLLKRYRAAFDKSYRVRYKTEFLWFVRLKLSSILFSCISFLTALTLIFPTVKGELSAGLFMALVSAVFSLVQSMSWTLSYVTDGFAKKNEYMKDFHRFFLLSEQPGALDDARDTPMEFQSLVLQNVSFTYPGTEKKVLDGVNLTIRSGEHISFVGVNGAGKTTITKLLLGLYDGFEGRILINGRPICEYSQAELKSLFAPVFQDFARYQLPLRETVTVGHVDREPKLEAALRGLSMEDAVGELPKGADTFLGKLEEGGTELSGGQWQRLAIARALVNPAPVRILDEPTAALDPVAESEVYGLFQRESKGITTLFISHRLGSTKLADRICVLDGGRVAEEGTHEQLLEKGGIYAEMYEAQRSWYR